MENKSSFSASYAAAGVDITAGYRAVELMKAHIARTITAACVGTSGASAASLSWMWPAWSGLSWCPAPTA